MSTITVRISTEENELIQETAYIEGKTVSEYIKLVVMEKIENDYDLRVATEAMREYEDDPVTFTLEDVKKKYDF